MIDFTTTEGILIFFMGGAGLIFMIIMAIILINAEYQKISSKIIVAFFLIISFVAVTAAVGVLVKINKLGNPAPFSRITDKKMVVYEIGDQAGREGVFWISSEMGGSIIFSKVPPFLRKKGVKFIIHGDNIITVKNKFNIKEKK